MKAEYIKYTKRLGLVGETTQKTADLFGLLSKKKDATIEEYRNANMGYEKCRQDVLSIDPPFDLKMEHKEIVDGYQTLINSVKVMISSINSNDNSRDEQKFQDGLSLMRTAVKLVENAGNKIINKILGK